MTLPAEGVPLDALADTLLPPSVPRVTVDLADLPDHRWRDSWAFDPARGAVINMTRARAQHIGRIRTARAPLLSALDVRFQRSLEDGDAAAGAAVVAEKRRLRALPEDPAIAAATSPADLAAAWPALLGSSPYIRSAAT